MARGYVKNEARRVCEWRRGVESESVANLLARVIDKLLDQCQQVLQLEEAVFFRKRDGIRPAIDRFVVIFHRVTLGVPVLAIIKCRQLDGFIRQRQATRFLIEQPFAEIFQATVAEATAIAIREGAAVWQSNINASGASPSPAPLSARSIW